MQLNYLQQNFKFSNNDKKLLLKKKKSSKYDKN